MNANLQSVHRMTEGWTVEEKHSLAHRLVGALSQLVDGKTFAEALEAARIDYTIEDKIQDEGDV